MQIQTLRFTIVLALAFFATAVGAVPLGNTYFVGVDGLATLPSGTYAGLENPNAGRLTFLLGHGNHYHGLGSWSYSGPASSPTVESTNSNNTIPELYTELPPLSLLPGSGAYAGTWMSGLGSAPQDLEYGDLGMLATAVLAATGDPADAALFNSSSGRWTGSLGSQSIGLELVSISAGLQIGDALGNALFGAGVGSIESLGVGDSLAFDPVFFTSVAEPADYSATFRLLDLGTAEGGAAVLGDSGTFNLAFTVVPAPGTALLMGFGLIIGLATVRRSPEDAGASAGRA